MFRKDSLENGDFQDEGGEGQSSGEGGGGEGEGVEDRFAGFAQADEGEVVGRFGFEAGGAQGVEAHVAQVHLGAAVGAIERVAAEEVAFRWGEAAVAALADEAAEEGATETDQLNAPPALVGGRVAVGLR